METSETVLSRLSATCFETSTKSDGFATTEIYTSLFVGSVRCV